MLIIETYATLPADKVSAYAMVRDYLAGKGAQHQNFCDRWRWWMMKLLKYLIIGVITYYVIVYGFCHVVIMIADVLEVTY